MVPCMPAVFVSSIYGPGHLRFAVQLVVKIAERGLDCLDHLLHSIRSKDSVTPIPLNRLQSRLRRSIFSIYVFIALRNF